MVAGWLGAVAVVEAARPGHGGDVAMVLAGKHGQAREGKKQAATAVELRRDPTRWRLGRDGTCEVREEERVEKKIIPVGAWLQSEWPDHNNPR